MLIPHPLDHRAEQDSPQFVQCEQTNKMLRLFKSQQDIIGEKILSFTRTSSLHAIEDNQFPLENFPPNDVHQLPSGKQKAITAKHQYLFDLEERPLGFFLKSDLVSRFDSCHKFENGHTVLVKNKIYYAFDENNNPIGKENPEGEMVYGFKWYHENHNRVNEDVPLLETELFRYRVLIEEPDNLTMEEKFNRFATIQAEETYDEYIERMKDN